MTKFQKYALIIVSILLVISLTMDVALFRAIYINPNRVQVNYETLSSTLIPESMDDVTILYFTDLQYGEYENQKRVENLFDEINDLHPDIVIFGGDLMDTNTEESDETKAFLVSMLQSIDAPLGKFAVYGEKDLLNDTRKQAVKDIYKEGQVELLHNKKVSISNYSTSNIRLVGLTSSKGIDSSFKDISGSTYNLLVTHKPDTLADEDLASKSVSFALTGHSHGTQISYPITGGYKDVDGATTINRKKKKNLSFDYLISSGAGNTNVNARLNATPEIVYFTLSHK